MADRQVTIQTIFGLLAKLDNPDADLRYMSLNDLYGILSGPSSTFVAHDHRASSKLTEGLLKALDDQHGDVQNQALKWSVPNPPRSLIELTVIIQQSWSAGSPTVVRVAYSPPREVGRPDCLTNDRHLCPQHRSPSHR